MINSGEAARHLSPSEFRRAQKLVVGNPLDSEALGAVVGVVTNPRIIRAIRSNGHPLVSRSEPPHAMCSEEPYLIHPIGRERRADLQHPLRRPTMSTNSRTWKKAEARVAALVGARRQVLSGSSGRDDRTQSDTTHPRVFIEAKYRQRHAVRSLFDETKAKAPQGGQDARRGLIDKGRPGCLVCVHSDDLPDLGRRIHPGEHQTCRAGDPARASGDPEEPPRTRRRGGMTSMAELNSRRDDLQHLIFSRPDVGPAITWPMPMTGCQSRP